MYNSQWYCFAYLLILNFLTIIAVCLLHRVPAILTTAWGCIFCKQRLVFQSALPLHNMSAPHTCLSELLFWWFAYRHTGCYVPSFTSHLVDCEMTMSLGDLPCLESVLWSALTPLVERDRKAIPESVRRLGPFPGWTSHKATKTGFSFMFVLCNTVVWFYQFVSVL